MGIKECQLCLDWHNCPLLDFDHIFLMRPVAERAVLLLGLRAPPTEIAEVGGSEGDQEQEEEDVFVNGHLGEKK